MSAPLARFENDLQSLVPDGARGYLLAVSGGADSTALLRLFAELRTAGHPLTDGVPIVVGHVHHGIRSSEADRDLSFVEGLARSHDFDCVTTRLDVVAEKTLRQQSLEHTARALRHEAFVRWSTELGLDTIVTAHHADDQVETVLFRIVRGTGLGGLTGIPPRRRLGEARTHQGDVIPFLIRPLLGWSRDEIRNYLGQIGQSYQTDSSNADTSIARNALRNEVLPVLEHSVHAGTRAAILRLARTALGWRRDLDDLAQQHWQDVHCVDEDSTSSLTLKIAVFLKLPTSVQVMILTRALEHVAERLERVTPSLSESRWREIARRLGDRSSARVDRVDLGSDWWLEVTGEQLRILHGDAPSNVHADEKPVPPPAALDIPGEVCWNGWTIVLEKVDDAPDLHASDPWSEIIDLDAVTGRKVVVRGRRPGDRFHPLGASGGKLLKEFLRERSIPRQERDHIPLVTTHDAPKEVIWVPGERLAHPFRVTKTTTRWCRILCRRSSD